MKDSEFAWINELAERFGAGRLADDVYGIGDDAAVLPAETSSALVGSAGWVVSVDSQVSGVHFESGWLGWEDLGRRLLHIGFSDIAAMGAAPEYALVSVEVGPGVTASDRRAFADGIAVACRDLNARLIGGNVSARREGFSAHVTAIGSVRAGGPMLRSGARPGDAVYVTGTLGDAAAGIAILRAGQSTDSPTEAALVEAYRRPRAHWREGLVLAEADWVHAAIDVSDGLAADLGHLCDSSEVGATLLSDAAPLGGALVAWCRDHGRDPLDLALHGGEEYVLLFTAPPDAEREARVRSRLPAYGGLWRIGTITESRQMTIVRDGREEPLAPLGYDHLAR